MKVQKKYQTELKKAILISRFIGELKDIYNKNLDTINKENQYKEKVCYDESKQSEHQAH